LDEAVPRVLINGAIDLLHQPSMPVPTTYVDVEAQTLPSMLTWLEIVYISVGGCLVFRTLLGVGLSLRILARAIPARPEWAEGICVRFSRDVAGPVTIARTIVLPTDAVDWAAETRQAVLAHEYAHVSRMDYAMLVVSHLNRAMFWFSPLSWWLHRKLTVLTELVSDDQAIEITRDRIGYAETLLEMAQRPEPLARGPSMAGLPMLALRIDRILLGKVTPSQASRWQWVTLTSSVAAVSLTIANFAPSLVLKPGAADPSDLDSQEIGVEKPGQDVLPSTMLLPDKAPETRISHATEPKIVVPFIARTQQARVNPRLRPTGKTTARNTPEVLTSEIRQVSKPNPVFQTMVSSSEIIVVGQKKAPAAAEESRNMMPAQNSASEGKNEILYPRETINAPLRANLERLNGSTCVGTVAVGMGAYYSGGESLEPHVTAGQIIPTKAQFFQKADGSSWVRFGSFERPPLDLKVQPTRTGVTWTGEYGITYAVQDTGNGRFIGLAAKIAHDSAALNFICRS